MGSHDLEDVIALIDGREETLAEVRAAKTERNRSGLMTGFA
jgi:hypothetical protein